MLSDPGNYIERISENILETRFENFDQGTLQNVKKRIIDVVGCLIGGVNAPGNLPIIDLVKNWGGREEATIFVHGGKAPAHNVAMVNSIMARSFDFEAIGAFVEGVDLPSHISVTTVFTALALGEATGVSGKELITALLVGDDIACRILAATDFGFALGWDGNGTINAFGATAIAGRLLGLTKTQMRNAFGIMLNQLAGSFQNIWDGSYCFKFPNGLSARNGIFSAELARAGWNGPEDALFSKFGYFHLYTEGCTNPEILVKDLGNRYYTEATFKPYPCCRANHAAVDCALNLVSKHEIDINSIKEIILKVPPRVRNMFVGQPFKIRATPQIDAAFNLRFCVANVLLRKNLSLEHFNENLIKEPEITNIAGKIAVEELSTHERSKMAASLKIIMVDDREYFTEVAFARGGPVHNSLSLEEIKEKFMNNVAFSQAIPKENAEKYLKLVESLENIEEIGEMIKLLAV